MLVFQVSFLGSELVFSSKSLRLYIYIYIYINKFTCDFKRVEKALLGEQGWNFKSKNLSAHSHDKDIKVALQFNKLPFFISLGDADPESNDAKYTVLLMESVHKISQELSRFLNDNDRKKLAKIMRKLGFDDLVPLFYEMPPDHERKVNRYHFI